MNQTW